MIMYFQNANPKPKNIEPGPAANENAGAAPKHTPAAPRQRSRAPELATRSDIRAMLVLATEGAVDIWAGHKSSPYLDRFEILHEKHSASPAACPNNAGDTDLGFLLRRARTAFADFGETIHREIARDILAGSEEKALDQALERVQDSAIATAASLASSELALAKG